MACDYCGEAVANDIDDYVYFKENKKISVTTAYTIIVLRIIRAYLITSPRVFPKGLTSFGNREG